MDYPYLVRVWSNIPLLTWSPLIFNFKIIFVYSTNEAEGTATRTEADQSEKVEHGSEAAKQGSRPASGNITTILASAGHTLDGADAELVLNPLRLAFETKNLKIFEPALDCVHVCACLIFWGPYKWMSEGRVPSII